MRKIKNKFLNVLAVLILLFVMVIPWEANAKEPSTEGTLVEFTEDIAADMASRFASSIAPDKKLTVTSPIKFFNTSNQAIGYIVNYYNEGIPYGYVIFDSTLDDLISEYCISENAVSPYQTALQNSDASIMSLQDSNIIYKLDNLTYGFSNANTEQVITNSGQTFNTESIIDKPSPDPGTRSNTPTTWDVIFISPQVINEDYGLIETNYNDLFCSLSESYVETLTQHYACAVSAMAICADYYGLLDYAYLSDDYMELWSLSDTQQSHTDNGIIYGGTIDTNVGPAFVSFCSSKGMRSTYNFHNYPSYRNFKSFIDRGDIGIIHCGIVKREPDGSAGRQGHAMAVQGYATLQKKGSNSKVQTVMVADGWNEYVRYINLGYGWTDLAVTEFFGNL